MNMKTLNAGAIKAKKDNLQKRFDAVKAQAAKVEQVRDKAIARLDQLISEMNSLQGSWRMLEELEKDLGVKEKNPSSLSAKKGKPKK